MSRRRAGGGAGTGHRPAADGARPGPAGECLGRLPWVRGDPVLQLRLVEVGWHGDAAGADPGRLRNALIARDQAHHGEGHGHQREQDGQAGRDPGQVERETGAAGGDEVAEDPVGEVRCSRRGPQGRGDDEPELGQRTAQGGEHGGRAGRPVAVRVDRVEHQPEAEDHNRQAHGQHRDDGHEDAPLPQLEVLGCDQPPGGQPRSGPAGPGGSARRAGAGDPPAGHGRLADAADVSLVMAVLPGGLSRTGTSPPRWPGPPGSCTPRCRPRRAAG